MSNVPGSGLTRVVIVVSIVLLFFTVPHTLEDFATGEPAEAGIPAAALSLVVSVILGLQALGLYWIGRGKRRGFVMHAVIGLFWPVASGIAQLPTILGGMPYRSGFISVFYVAGIIVLGVSLLVLSLLALRRDQSRT